MNWEKRLKEIQDRKTEIRSQLEGGEDINLEEVESELRTLQEEESQLEEKRAKALEIRNAMGEVRSFEKPKEERGMDFANMTPEELLESKEYRSAYLKNLQGKPLSDVESRALTTAANSAGAAVPTTTLNRIIDKLRQTSALFSRISVSYIPGNVVLPVANAKNAAAWKAEGTDGTPQDDTISSVTLSGYELIKLVEISAAAEAMTIDAFEAYIAAEIGRQMAIAVENAILNGAGANSNQPTGILPGITWDASNKVEYAAGTKLVYNTFMDALALLPTMYHPNAVFVMNRKTLFGDVRKIKTTDGAPIFAYNAQDQAAMSILGYPVVMDDYMPDGEVLLGDLEYYFMNFAKAPGIETSKEAGFRSGKLVYRGLAVADGKPALPEAFVRVEEASV